MGKQKGVPLATRLRKLTERDIVRDPEARFTSLELPRLGAIKGSARTERALLADAHPARAEIAPVGPDFAMYVKRTTQAVQRGKDEQERYSYGRETGRRRRRYPAGFGAKTTKLLSVSANFNEEAASTLEVLRPGYRFAAALAGSTLGSSIGDADHLPGAPSFGAIERGGRAVLARASRERRRRAGLAKSRGGAAAATRIFCGGRVAAAPRPRRGYSVGDESRHRRGRDVGYSVGTSRGRGRDVGYPWGRVAAAAAAWDILWGQVAAAAGTWDIPWGRVAARPRRGIFRGGGGSRRGYRGRNSSPLAGTTPCCRGRERARRRGRPGRRSRWRRRSSTRACPRTTPRLWSERR